MMETSYLIDGSEAKSVRVDLKRIQELEITIADLKAQIKELDLSKMLKQAETELKELSEPILNNYKDGIFTVAGHGNFKIAKTEGGETVAFTRDIKGKEEFAELETMLRANGLVSKSKDKYKFDTIDID